jgi:hypothetical protein
MNIEDEHWIQHRWKSLLHSLSVQADESDRADLMEAK